MARYLELRPVIRARLEATVPHELRAECGAVTPHQLRALSLLGSDGLPMRRLAEELGVMGATASVLADRLVAHGLAQRRHDPVDRRVTRLVPTETGMALASRYAEAQRRAADALFDVLSEPQVESLIEIMETLAQAPLGEPEAARRTAAPSAASASRPLERAR